jgi:hypothetical protein
MELIFSILCDSNANIISYENNTKLYKLIDENNTKLYELIVTFLLCKRSELTSCDILYEGVPLAALLETITLDILLSDLVSRRPDVQPSSR